MAKAPKSADYPGSKDKDGQKSLSERRDPVSCNTEAKEKAAFDTTETPHAREAPAADQKATHDQLSPWGESAEDRQEALVDESLDESFPASDPPSAKHIT